MLCGYTPFWNSGSPMRIYENILKGKVKYPSYIHADAQSLLERLITADLTKRFGNLYGGSQDVRNHPWFAEVTWDRLARKDIDAPYIPPPRPAHGTQASSTGIRRTRKSTGSLEVLTSSGTCLPSFDQGRQLTRRRRETDGQSEKIETSGQVGWMKRGSVLLPCRPVRQGQRRAQAADELIGL